MAVIPRSDHQGVVDVPQGMEQGFNADRPTVVRFDEAEETKELGVS